jgi:hypothetical protein
MHNAQQCRSPLCSHLIMYLVAKYNIGTSRTFALHTKEDNQTVISSLNNTHSVKWLHAFIVKCHKAVPMRIRPKTRSQLVKVCVRKSENLSFRNDICPKHQEKRGHFSKSCQNPKKFKNMRLANWTPSNYVPTFFQNKSNLEVI